MTILDGQEIKKFDLYPLAQPQLNLSTFVWQDLGNEEQELKSIA